MIERVRRYARTVTAPAVDWTGRPTVVFESDDWGLTPIVRTAEERDGMVARLPAAQGPSVDDPGVMERLFGLLGRFRGADGRAAVFTAFVLPAFPDFRAIEKSGFTEYSDIGVAEGFAPFGERGAIARVWREGWARGVFHPEFHARLHHTSPIIWLELLRGTGSAAGKARERFTHFQYAQGIHIAEFAKMDAQAQHEWTAVGVRQFVEAVGYAPSAAVTSDATPVTEVVWAANGIRTFCLRNCRNNNGEVVVYDNKPWNAQDPYGRMGEFDEDVGLVSLNRNVFFENRRADQGADAALATIEAVWGRNEPAVVSTHAGNYAGRDPDRGFAELERLLGVLAGKPDVRFLTSAEVGDICRRGWSLRRCGAERILRYRRPERGEVRLDGPVKRIAALPGGAACRFADDAGTAVFAASEGDYLIE